MALFPSSVPADNESPIIYLATQLQNGQIKTLSAIVNAAGVTLTAAQITGGIINRSGATAVNDTFPTAALLVAALVNPQVGTAVEFSIVNTNTGTLTLVAGTGDTLAGTTTIATLNTRRYLAVVTNATVGSEAITYQGLFVAAN